MSINKLHIAEVSQNCPSFQSQNPREGRRQQLQALMERAWLQNPEQFNPERDCVQRQRVERTLKAFEGSIDLQGKKGVDLGCGAGFITRKVRDFGTKSIDAVDVAAQALKLVQEHGSEGIKTIQDCLPSTRLNDSDYDIVICTEMIGYLDPKEYRLLFAELSRLVKNSGIVICSTSLDSDTQNPLALFSQLADSEFEPLNWVLSYHHSFLRLCKFFEAPAKRLHVCKDPQDKRKILDSKKGLSLVWNQFLLSKPLQGIWWTMSTVFTPLGKMLRQCDRTRNVLESISRFFLGPDGASHVIFVGKRRPLTFPLPPNEVPKEHPGKRQVWE